MKRLLMALGAVVILTGCTGVTEEVEYTEIKSPGIDYENKSKQITNEIIKLFSTDTRILSSKLHEFNEKYSAYLLGGTKSHFDETSDIWEDMYGRYGETGGTNYRVDQHVGLSTDGVVVNIKLDYEGQTTGNPHTLYVSMSYNYDGNLIKIDHEVREGK